MDKAKTVQIPIEMAWYILCTMIEDEDDVLFCGRCLLSNPNCTSMDVEIKNKLREVIGINN